MADEPDMKKRRFGWASGGAVLVACLTLWTRCAGPTVKVFPLDGYGSEPRAPKLGRVSVYPNPDAVKKPFVEIAILRDPSRAKDTVERLRAQAGKMGADAIILVSEAEVKDGRYPADEAVRPVLEQKGQSAVAIVFSR